MFPPLLVTTKAAVFPPEQEPCALRAGGFGCAVLVGNAVSVGVAVGRRRQEPVTLNVTDERNEVR